MGGIRGFLLPDSAGPTKTAEVIDLNAASPTWQIVAPDGFRAQAPQRHAPAGRHGAGDGRQQRSRGYERPIRQPRLCRPRCGIRQRIPGPRWPATPSPRLPFHRAPPAGRPGPPGRRRLVARDRGVLAAVPVQGRAPDDHVGARRRDVRPELLRGDAERRERHQRDAGSGSARSRTPSTWASGSTG